MMEVYETKPFFRDRADAGRQLAQRLTQYGGDSTIVFGIPRGGVPVGVEVADALGAAFDIIIPRKIGFPDNPEAGFGAVTEDGSIALNEPLVRRSGLTEKEIMHQVEKVRREVERRISVFRDKLPPSSVRGKTAIIVDDGLATGFTMIAAIKSMQKRGAATIVATAQSAGR
ncbi:MAG: phosphoribosyltransferase family protein [bacterium]